MDHQSYILLSILIVVIGLPWIEKRLSHYFYFAAPVDWATLQENIRSAEKRVFEQAVVFTFDQVLTLADCELSNSDKVLGCLVNAVNRDRKTTLSYLSEDKRGQKLQELLDTLVNTKVLQQDGSPSKYYWERKLFASR